jgi:hypothetical protein
MLAANIDNHDPLSRAPGVHDETPAQRSLTALHVAI